MLVAIPVTAGSALDGATVASSVGHIEGATAVAILRAEEMVTPRGPTPIHAGDQLVAIATPEAYELLQDAAAGP